MFTQNQCRLGGPGSRPVPELRAPEAGQGCGPFLPVRAEGAGRPAVEATFLPSLGSGARHWLAKAKMGRRTVWPRAGHSQVCRELPHTTWALLVGMLLPTLTTGCSCEGIHLTRERVSSYFRCVPAPSPLPPPCCHLGWRRWASLRPRAPLSLLSHEPGGPPGPTAQLCLLQAWAAARMPTCGVCFAEPRGLLPPVAVGSPLMIEIWLLSGNSSFTTAW